MLKIRRQYTNLYDKDPGITPSKDISSTVNTSSDSFCAEKEKPGSRNPGLDVAEEATSDDVVITTLPSSAFTDNANNYLAAEMGMGYYTNGFVKIPRSLLTDPRFSGAHALHRIVFLKILELACWAPTEFNDNGVIIKLEPGQVCISIRELAKACGEGVSRHWVAGALGIFTTLRFLGQEVRHQKSIITITHSDTYDHFKNTGRTASRTEVGQRSDIKEDHKSIRKENKRERKTVALVASADALRLFSLFIETLKKTLPDLKMPKNLEGWKAEFQELLEKDKRSADQVEKAILSLPGHFYSPNVCSAKKFRREFHRFTIESQPSKTVTVSLLQNRLSGSYTVDYKDGMIILISKQNYPVARFAKNDMEGLDKWLKMKGM